MKDSHKKIKSLFYIVCIISMIITILGKVSAEEMDSDLQEIVDGYVRQFSAESGVTIPSDVLDTIYSNCPYVQIYSVNRYNYKFIDFYCNKNLGILYCRYDGTFYNIPMYISDDDRNYVAASSSNVNVTGNKCYRIFFGSSSYSIYEINITNSSVRYDRWGYSSTYLYGFSSNYSTISGSTSLDNSSSEVHKSIILSYGNIFSQDYLSFSVAEDTWEPVTVDPNFSIYKTYGTGGIPDPVLNIQYLDDIFSEGYTYTSETTYTLTFDVDGSSISVPISSNTYPDDFLENGMFRTSYDLIYRMLSNKILDFGSVENVTLTGVSLSGTAYPTADHLGTPETVTKSTLCNLVLKGSSGIDAESENIPAVSDKTIVFDQVANSGDFFNHTGVWHNDVNMPDWAELYEVCIYDDYELLLSDVVTAGYNADWTIEQSALDRYKFKGFVDPTFININNAQVDYYNNLDLIKDNIARSVMFENIVKYADIVKIYYVVGDGNGDPSLAGDYIFYTYNYYNKLTIKGIGNVQSAVESGTYYTKSLYWYLKQRLDNMSGYLVPYINESKNNQIIQNGYLQSINTNVLTIKDSIEGGVNRIVNAISGISGGSSYSLPSLSTELQRLFIPSLTWQSIDFDEYMNSLGVLSLPFTFTNDVLTTADNSYSPTLDLHINDFALDVTGSNDVLTVFEDQDYSFNPRSIFANNAWTMLTYLNAFALILGEAWITYCHIFRREKSNDC